MNAIPMRPAFEIDFSREIVVDNFAGGGGASTGIEAALGFPITVALNHDREACAMYEANHPGTQVLCQSVWQADPRDVAAGRPVGLAWFSPDCKHFSKAKGATPVEKHIRDLAWVVVHWAKLVRPRIIMLENVEEFRDWGDLHINDAGELVPDPSKKGKTFKRWWRQIERQGYKGEARELIAYEFGAPTIRKRLYIIFRCDGQPVTWPTPTHTKPGKGPATLRPWRTAAEIIDWSLPCPSIFFTREQARDYWRETGTRINRPLAPATMARIARGVKRYVLDAKEPFIVPVTHAGDFRSNPTSEPLRTQTTTHRGEHALVTPFVTKFNSGAAGHRMDEPLHTVTSHHSDSHPAGASPLGLVTPFLARTDMASAAARNGIHSPDEPFRTQTTSPSHAVVVPVLAGCGGRAGQSPERPGNVPLGTLTAKPDGILVAPTLVQTGYGEREGQAPRSLDIGAPIGTQVAGGAKHALVSAFLAQHNTDMVGHDAREPVSTIVEKGCTQGLVAAHMLNMKGSARRDAPMGAPLLTLTADGGHAALVASFLMKYYGEGGQWQDARAPLHTVTTKDRVGIVTVTIAGEEWVLADIGMRMLNARERFNAQGFSPDYIIDLEYQDVDGKTGQPVTKRLSATAQGRMCGNSVCPPVAEALVRANFMAREAVAA